MPFYEKGPVRIHYEEIGEGYPLLLIPMQLVYPLYVVIVTVISFFGKGKWKGRKLVNN